MKLKRIEPGKYQIVGTDLTIEKGEPARFGYKQDWSVMKDQWPVFTAYGKQGCVDAIETILDAFNQTNADAA